jgi:hypothetical protein
MDFTELNIYERRHLIEHLLGAKLQDFAHKILADFDGAYTWSKYRVTEEGNFAGYLSDLEFAYAALSAESSEGWPVMIGYALAKSSAAARASNVDPRLVRLLVQEDMWTPQQCIDTLRSKVSSARAQIRSGGGLSRRKA